MENKHTQPKPPKILYQYCPPELQTMENLSRRVMYFNAPANFNDPYDCLITSLPGDFKNEEFLDLIKAASGNAIDKISPEQRDVLLSEGRHLLLALCMSGMEEEWNKAREAMGIRCLSVCEDNLLMWSHYGGYGKGLCLAFDTQYFGDNSIPLHEVEYKETRFNSDVSQVLRGYRTVPRNIFLHKYKVWEYEQEWRALREGRGECSYPAEILKAVYFGTQTTDETKLHIRAIVRYVYPHAELWQGRLSRTEYKVEFDRIR